MTIKFGIITPTFSRQLLLRRHLRRVRRQTYHQWHLLVVHDGPSPSTRYLVESFRADDSRISYLETTFPANDSGVTPRLEGVSRLIADEPFPDYVVFWDDDNAYAGDALQRIAVALESAGKPDLLLVSVRPDLLLVSVRYGLETIPPPQVPIRSLKVGQVDTASLIFRPLLARDAYASVHRHSEVEEVLRFIDFLAYQYVRRLDPPASMARNAGPPVCRHDGLRWGPFIRQSLRIPPLSIARLIGLGR